MKIAVIDTGILKEEVSGNCVVKHFSLSDEGLVNVYQKPVNNHGTKCFKEISGNTENKNIQIYDLNILKDGENLEVSNIILAIEKAVKERVDIINISLGLKNYSQELYDMCERAVCNNIVIVSAASHTNTISFPADFDNVICVKVDQSQTEKIKVTNTTTVSIAMRDFIVVEGKKKFDFSSSSLACARFCRYLCDEFGDNLLNDKYKILAHKYGIYLYRDSIRENSLKLKENSLQEILQKNRVAVVVFPSSALSQLDAQFLHKSIVAYYDHGKYGFYSVRENRQTKNFDYILVLNTSYNDMEISKAIQEKYKKYKVICIGNYLNVDGNKLLQKYSMYKSSELSVLERPVIAVASLCSGLNKSEVQLSLLKGLKKDGLDIGAISNNPIGLLYGINVFSFPNELIFPNIVYSINRFMYLYEINTDIDAWLINIGGATGQVNSLNTYNFGKLVDAYLSAANIDVIVLCVNPSVDVEFLKLQIGYLYKQGVEKVFLVLSHNDINATTTDYKDGLQTYYVDNKKYMESFEYLRSNIQEKIFMLEDVQNGKLYDDIIESLS